MKRLKDAFDEGHVVLDLDASDRMPQCYKEGQQSNSHHRQQ